MNGEIDKRNKRLHELSAKLCLSGIGSMTERELFELVEMYAFGVQCPSARESMMRKYKSYAELIRSDGRGDGSLVQGFIRLVQESALVLARGSNPHTVPEAERKAERRRMQPAFCRMNVRCGCARYVALLQVDSMTVR